MTLREEIEGAIKLEILSKHDPDVVAAILRAIEGWEPTGNVTEAVDDTWHELDKSAFCGMRGIAATKTIKAALKAACKE